MQAENKTPEELHSTISELYKQQYACGELRNEVDRLLMNLCDLERETSTDVKDLIAYEKLKLYHGKIKMRHNETGAKIAVLFRELYLKQLHEFKYDSTYTD